MTEPGTSAAASARLFVAVAALVFALALVQAFAGHWGADWSEVVPMPAPVEADGVRGERRHGFSEITRNDYRMGVWAFARNARAWLHHPHRIFHAESCYPASRTLALHHPVVTQGLVGVPPYLLTGDPVRTTNVLLLLTALLGAAAMALLVADWTRSPAAAIVAGLLYAFHPAQLGSPFHLGTQDYTWTLLALFFAQRLFAHGRWRDGLGLAASGALQMGTSFYPLLGALLVAVPVAVWLTLHVGWRRVPGRPLALVAVLVACAGAFLFTPYLEFREAGVLDRETRFFADWFRFSHRGWLFPGYVAMALALVALLPGRARSLAGIRGDPRIALLVALLLATWLATGGNVEARAFALRKGLPPPAELPNLFNLLRGWLPGLESVRLPSLLGSATRMLLCLLAGLGAASLLRRLPSRVAPAAAALLVVAVAAETLRPPWLGFEPRLRFEPLQVRPAADTIALFEELEEAGNRGPLLELPIDPAHPRFAVADAPLRHLLSAWHHRRTSGCAAAYTPPEVRDLAALADRVASPGVLDEIRALGFTTLVVHHRVDRRRPAMVRPVLERIARRSGRLERLGRTDAVTVYALSEAASGGPAPSEP